MNDLEEFEYMNRLYEIYGSLLTEKQILIMDDYYKYNLSISEISENYKITRSAAMDTIKHSRMKLEEFEEKLQILHKNDKIIGLINNSSLNKEEKEKILKEL